MRHRLHPILAQVDISLSIASDCTMFMKMLSLSILSLRIAAEVRFQVSSIIDLMTMKTWKERTLMVVMTMIKVVIAHQMVILRKPLGTPLRLLVDARDRNIIRKENSRRLSDNYCTLFSECTNSGLHTET